MLQLRSLRFALALPFDGFLLSFLRLLHKLRRHVGGFTFFTVSTPNKEKGRCDTS
jgi:hypothetical protein